MARAVGRRLLRTGRRARFTGLRRRMARRVIRRAAVSSRLVRRRAVGPAVMTESAAVTPVSPVVAPEISMEDPMVRATRAELRQWVGQRVQLLLAASAVPEITPWDTDGTLVSVGESLVTLRPAHGPNAGAEIRYALQGLLGFIPLSGMDPTAPRWEAVNVPGPPDPKATGTRQG